jgi:hypothetical protein
VSISARWTSSGRSTGSTPDQPATPAAPASDVSQAGSPDRRKIITTSEDHLAARHVPPGTVPGDAVAFDGLAEATA